MERTICVSTIQMKGWCDYKVQPVVKAVMTASNEELFQTLEATVLKGHIVSNFLPFPFTKQSSHGRRLLMIWEQVKEKYPNSAVVRGFVWKFWNPRADAVDAHFMNGVTGEALIVALSARTLAFLAADVRC